MFSEALLCLVVGISDGDTLTTRCGAPGQYEQVKIRLAGVDAPERKQPYGNASRQHLSDLCFQTEALIAPKGKDRYKRTVADVECRGLDAGTEQVRAGMAWVYVVYAKKHQLLYQWQGEAQAFRRGLWADPNATPPWNWRKP